MDSHVSLQRTSPKQGDTEKARDPLDFHVPVHDAREDGHHGFVIELIDRHRVQVTQEARCDHIASTSRGTHGSDKLQIHQLYSIIGL